MSETDVDLDIAIGQCQARSLWQTLTGNPSADLNEQTRSRVLALLLELRDRRAASVGSEVREEWGVLLGEISLYVEWRWVTSQLTTAQKELWADAVDAWSARLNDGDPADTTPADRWWRS